MAPLEQAAPSHFKPGKTINKHERHYVIHNYHDFANEPDDPAKAPVRRRKGGVTTPFPIVLHRVIQQIQDDGLSHIFGWQPHGRCFVIFQPKLFVQVIMPKYFKLGKLSSFQRQLNLYGFNRITRGLDATGYYHEYFLRDREYLAKRILRKRIKGTKIKGATNPDLEPDFYAMPAVQKHPDPTLAPATVTRGTTTTNSSSSTHSSDDGDSSTASAAVVSSSEAEIAAVANAMAHHNPQQQQPPLCNFVFPQFFLPSSSSDDPVDDALWPTMPLLSSSSSSPKEDHHHHEAPWDDQPLSDSILLGQYLVFGEDDVEAV